VGGPDGDFVAGHDRSGVLVRVGLSRTIADAGGSVNGATSLVVASGTMQRHATLPEVGAHPFVIDEYVRWSDVDYAGVIFYGAYVRFFEIAETELFRAAGMPYGQVFERFGIWLPRVHLESDFMSPARLDDQLRVAAYFTRFGRSSITINFDVLILSDGRLAAAGHEVLVCTERERLRSQALPAELLDRLRPFRIDKAEARRHLGLTS